MKNRLITALVSKYTADIHDALARLEIYLKSPVAIGEHPQHTEEIDKLVQQYTDAESKKIALHEMYNELFSDIV
jgi:methylaspartate ammonia-lyase